MLPFFVLFIKRPHTFNIAQIFFVSCFFLVFTLVLFVVFLTPFQEATRMQRLCFTSQNNIYARLLLTHH